jgi:hypothetical protein
VAEHLSAVSCGDAVASDLDSGAVVTIGHGHLRVRILPVRPDD